MAIQSGFTTTLQKAVAHHEQGQLAEAEALYQEIVDVDPNHPDALHLLGVLEHQRNRNEAAVEYIARAISAHHDAPLFHSNLGASLRALGRVSDAAQSFRTAIRLDPTFAGAHYNLAMALEELGQPREAEASYKQAVRHDAHFVDAYNNLGRLLAAQRRYAEAIECFQAVIADAPNAPGAHYNLGNAYQENSQPVEAERCYREALRLDPAFAEAANNLGSLLRTLDRSAEAIACFEQALESDECNTSIRFNRGALLIAQGSKAEGIDHLRRCIQFEPDNAPIRSAVADVLRENGLSSEAEWHYAQAIALDPTLTSAHFGLGYIHLSQGDHAAARDCFEGILRLDPNHTAALSNVGYLHLEAGDVERAAHCYQRVVDLLPRSAEAHYNLGNAYKDLSRLAEAVACYQRAIALNPNFVQPHINLGLVLKRQGNIEAALDSHRRSIELAPDDAEARFHNALALLLAGDLEQGWDEYEWRWRYDANPRDFGVPVWDGTSLSGRKLLIYAEQGVGDEIMFASCLPEIVGQPDRCTIECDGRLVPLFARSFPAARVVPRPLEMIEDAPASSQLFDLQIPLGSLPRYLRGSLGTFPAQRRYLIADPQKQNMWKDRLAALGPGLKIGISWEGGGKPSTRKERSIRLSRWQENLSVPGVHFINLQYGEPADEIAAVAAETGIRVHNWDDANPRVDLDGFAAQISQLDLVISVDNSTVHMAGALGVPVWTLLPFCPNWRWMLNREDSPWYAGMRLFRQPSPQQWDAVLTRVAGELSELNKAAATGESPASFTMRRIVRANDERFSVSPPQSAKPATISLASPSAAPSRQASRILELPSRQCSPLDIVGSAAKPDLVPSPASSQALREKKKYETIWTHDDYRKFSPGLHDADKIGLINLLRQHGVKTVLDAGCGSGKLMRRLMTECAGEFAVHGFDISDNCLDPYFDTVKDSVLTVGCLWDPNVLPKKFDAVICTDVMEHIPTEHVPSVLGNLRRWTNKFCYVAIALFADRFGPELLGEPLHLTVKEPGWWFSRLALAGFRVHAQTVEQNAAGVNMWLHAVCMPDGLLAPALAPALQTSAADCILPPGADPQTEAAVKTVLHVGCGSPNPESLHKRFRGPKWQEIRLDIDKNVKPDIIASMTDMSAVASNSVDAVWSSHNIEHLYPHEVPVALAEIYRVLKPGGLFFVTLPDLQQIAEFVVADRLDDVVYVSPAGPINTVDCIFGLGTAIAQGNHYMAHKTGFTKKSLTRHLAGVGFRNIRVTVTPINLWAEAFKLV